jgi:Zn-finger nucleic acid-binding protein
MIVLEVEKVEIDHCTACGGVWLDGGELELLLEAASNKDELMRTLAELTEGRAKKKRCPICARKLHQVKYGPERDLVLDRCTRGHGIWFDRDELCRALQFGRFERGRPVYDVLNDVFGGTCRNAPPDGPRTGGPSEEGVSKGS